MQCIVDEQRVASAGAGGRAIQIRAASGRIGGLGVQ